MKKVEYDQLENLYFIARKCDDFKEFMESASQQVFVYFDGEF